MTKAEAFLRQARSDFQVFEELWQRGSAAMPDCHPLQHLQMATEKLAKSARYTLGVPETSLSHVAFREMLHFLKRPDVARKLGYTDLQQFKRFLDAVKKNGWFLEIERLSPSVGTVETGGSTNSANVEYPWYARDSSGAETWFAPKDHEFPIAHYLRSRDGANLIKLVRSLLERLPSAVQP